MPPAKELKKLISYFVSKNAIGVEIGVDKGKTSVYLLTNLEKMGHLYCIDPYINREHRHGIVNKLLKEYDNCTFLRMKSHDAVQKVPDNLDFVFIDGDHRYRIVLQDLYDWVPKLKSGGLLSGHDWCNSVDKGGVPKAGTEYFSEHGDLFEPLIKNKKMKNMGLPYRIAGSGYIHKQINHKYPIWWRIKK